MKKLLAILLAVVMVFALAACGGGEDNNDKDTLKVGFIFLHDENSTYDKNFIDAAKAATEAMGLTDDQVVFKVNIPEGAECERAYERGSLRSFRGAA